jgi:hypothetical protein
MCGHSDTMAGAVIVRNIKDGDRSLAETLYFYQNAEGTGSYLHVHRYIP